MEQEPNVNRTVAVSDIHPCYEINNYAYVLTHTPSVICVLLNIFLGLLAVVTTCGNLLIVFSITYFKQLHTPTNCLILSLAVTDLLVGVLVFPFTMTFSLSSCLYHEDLFCQIRGSFDVSLSTSSILNLCCIAVDRYYAVCHPLTYRTKINGRVVVVMILVNWSISVLTGIGIMTAGLHHENCEKSCSMNVLLSSTLGPTFSFYLPAIVMVSIYLKIFLVAQKQARSIQNTTCQSLKSRATVSKMERKATKTLATVMGVFLMCWTPFFLCITFVPFTKNSVPVSVIETLNWVSLVNSMFNPFIYAFFYSWFRLAIRMIISGKVFRGDFTNSRLS
ncbi:trace amine-associated receptor 1-like [Mastacembelus armatus]|nr:trace amine-associated receptor 1-like [Mastacembelus armatus]